VVQAVSTLLEADGQGVFALLAQARSRLGEMVQYDPRLEEPRQVLDEALVQIQETVRDLNRYAEGVELDPEALVRLEARIAQVTDVARKLRTRPEGLVAVLESSRARLAELDWGSDVGALVRAETGAESAFLALARELSARRQEAGTKLAVAATAAMQQLAMKGGRFDVAYTSCTPEAGGLEDVEFLVSPHAGQPLRPVARTASGGELSRLGLALQTVLSTRSGAGTLIFDEVDAGIGGGVAEIVGRMLAALGRDKQVLCVTHLPQVAARAQRHWRVSKQAVDGHPVATGVDRLETGQRVEEIARMLGGVKITDTTRRHAREMLGAG
jgi:DNA repair protein RecN (Recombination protein N)